MGVVITSILFLGSCDMERYPLTSFSEETFYDDEANLKLALAGLYRGNITLGVNYSITDWWEYSATVLLDGVSDIGYDRRKFNNDLGRLTCGTITETNSIVKNAYQNSYKRINACSRFIDGLVNIANQNSEIERMEAEARFIRAVQYFYLASYYHDVPLVKTVLSMEESNTVKKSSREEVLNYAAEELNKVSKILPRHKDLSDSERGRATAQAALVYLARTYLVLEDFKGAEAACEQIIAWGDNTLYSDYQELFYPSGEGSSEHIFATQFIDDFAGTGLPQHAFPNKDGGWCIVNITNRLFEAYDFLDGTPFDYEDPRFDKTCFGANRDPRLDYTLYYDGATFRGTVYQCSPESTSADKIGLSQTQTGYLLRKFFDESWSGNINAYGNNVPLARYADVLLMYLEAKVRGGKLVTQSMLDQTINAVRGRTSVNMPPLTETDPEKLFKLIQKERMIELAFEGWRLWDLFRWGIAEEKLNEDIYGSPFYLSNPSLINMKDGQPDPYNRWYVNKRNFKKGQEVWPIPLAEKNINPNLK